MIGMSLSYKKLLHTFDEALKPEVLLPQLRAHGVRSIELRAVSPSDHPDDVLRVADLLWDYGFQITVHAKCKTEQNAVSEVFSPLSRVLSEMRQRELIITIHPVVGDNAAMLTALSDHISEKGYPAFIALENNRRMPDGTDGDSAALVLDAVRRVDRKNVGICFDMGHYAWYTENFTDSASRLPSREFLSRVIHTHIHACAEGVTHFPLDPWREPFSRYIEALSYKYYGVYNIELEPKRFSHRIGATEAYLLSADNLKRHYPIHASLYDDARFHYDEYFHHALDVFKEREGCYASLIAPSSYLFATHGYRWAMDVSFLYLSELAQTPSRVREYLGEIDLMILTHAHGDHMEESTIRALSDTEIVWVVPIFMVEAMKGFGVRVEKMIVVREGDEIDVGPLHIRVLKGRHFRPKTKRGINAVGYLITAEQGPTLAFPGDVRDYRITDEESLNADHCFAHVWLTDKALTPEKYIPKSEDLAEFALRMSRRSIFLTHLYANRSEDKMWQMHHAQLVSDAIRERSPGTVVRVPSYGEVWELS